MLSASRNRPNIVMLMLDTLRADRLGCYGYRRRTVSPAIDEVARGSILFERAIASAPWTLPSHASLFTGLHPSQHGADDVSLYLHERHRTLAERLSGAGYRTAAFCAHNAWFSAAAGLARGFQLCVGPELKEDASGLREMAARTADQEQYLSAEGCEVLGFARYCLHRLADRHAPLFLFLHSMINHQPYRPADASWDKLGADPVPADLTAHLAENFRELRANPETITAEQAEAMDLLYDACVATADELAARLIELIGRRLGWERTVLVITSDHRQNLGEHGMWGHWLCLADTLLHVPLLIYPRPFASLPARVSAPVQQADLCSTLLRLAGCAGRMANAAQHARRDLLQRALGQSEFDTHVFAEHSHPETTLRHIRRYNPEFADSELGAAKKCVRTAELKYVLHGTGSEYLYDLEADPAEQENRLHERSEEAASLRRALTHELGPFVEPQQAARPEEEFEPAVLGKLRDLGYV